MVLLRNFLKMLRSCFESCHVMYIAFLSVSVFLKKIILNFVSF